MTEEVFERNIDTPELLPDSAYAVVEKLGRYFVADEQGESVLHIPKDLGETVFKLLNLQKRLIKERFLRKDIIALLRMLNCRKSVFLASGQLSFADTFRKGGKASFSNLQELRDYGERDEDGIVMLFDDVERLLSLGKRPIIFGQHIEPLAPLVQSAGAPQVVHLFQILPKDILRLPHTVEDVIDMKPTLTHSFIVLGRKRDGTLLCFHKAGPHLDDPMEVVSLEDVLLRYVALPVATDTQAYFLAIYGDLEKKRDI